MDGTVPMPVIGVVRCGRTSLEHTPIQAALNRSEQGRIEIDPRYRDGLDGLERFAFAWLLTWLDQPGNPKPRPPELKQVPFLLRASQRRIGIFATRGPRRVNPIGLSLIQLLDITGTTVSYAGVDVVDGTAVIDLKPYVSRFDRPPGNPPCGWFDDITIGDDITPAGLGQTPPVEST
jgi:tRNA-Thr(GGU) m(6)t(6)A37 methyltransferase TsaA